MAQYFKFHGFRPQPATAGCTGPRPTEAGGTGNPTVPESELAAESLRASCLDIVTNGADLLIWS